MQLSRISFLIIFILFQLPLFSQQETASEELPHHLKFSEFIQLENLKHHVYALAADSMQGRDTGEPGGIMAGNYIERHFISMGIPAIGDTTYRQTMTVSWLRWEENEIRVNDSVVMRNFWDYLPMPKDNRTMEDWKIREIVFGGFGITEGSPAIMSSNSGEPQVLVIFRNEKEQFDLNTQLTKAGENGFDLILLVEENLRDIVLNNRRSFFRPLRPGTPAEPKSVHPNLIHVSKSFAEKLLPQLFEEVHKDSSVKALNEKLFGKKYPVELAINLVKHIRVLQDDNIMAYIEGTDPDKKDELIILTAHYDHIGYNEDEIFYGANDNASGTAAVMEMARAFQMAKEKGIGPARPVLLMLLTGEERGLLGSAYYVENPVFPLENTIVNINIDMIGRVDKKHKELGVNKYIYPIGSDRLSTELHEILLEVNEKYSNIHLDFTYNDPEDPNRYYFRSDHYNFARNGIPAIFFFNGLNDDYHKSTDTPDKIDYESMTAVTRHIFHLAWELANREEAIEADLWEEN